MNSYHRQKLLSGILNSHHLNPQLIKAPKVPQDHSPAFFRLQSRYMPDWEKWKERLERMMA